MEEARALLGAAESAEALYPGAAEMQADLAVLETSARTNRQHVEEVVSCGQFGDPLGQHQAGGTYPKSCLGPFPCLGESLSIEQPPEESL